MNGVMANTLLRHGADTPNAANDVPYQTTYLITGANRGLPRPLSLTNPPQLTAPLPTGIGKGLVAAYLLRANTTVIACVRNPATASPSLTALPKSPTSTLLILQLDCASETDAATAISHLRTHHAAGVVTHIDVVIANAAIAANFGPASTMPLAHLREHMMVNAYSVLLLFQATSALLQAARQPPRFVLVGAPISTITGMDEYARSPLFAYGVSKLAANYFVRKVHFENGWLVAFVVDPG